MSYLIFNGDLKPESEISVSPVNRGMMYGDGCFETLRSYNGRFLAFSEHIERLNAALGYLGMNPEFSQESLKKNIKELLEKNKLENKNALIRIQCWRDGERGFYTESESVQWIIQANEISLKKVPVKLALSSQKSIPSSSLSRKFKLSNGLNFILAASEVKTRGADDALMLNIQDFISETTISNIFWVHDSTVFTPSEDCDILPGITRNLILKLLRQNSISVEEGKFTIPHLLSANTVFCTNSIREIQEVSSLDGNDFETGYPIVEKIIALFDAFKEGNLSE